ncbi:protein kinase family protein [Streptomyces collinus]|uniref:protein kinase family protein n=1 Tax=Streptomyces collinus TaxID=42684 RepID=UPI002942A6FF|nr:protein kinase family protein [Streptomyces collinus]
MEPASGTGHAARVSAYAAVGARLSLFSDRRLRDLVAGARGLGSGVGGRAAELEVDGLRVFVKHVPLTDLELTGDRIRSTVNLFELPLFYQYGIGSAGFGAWRELAAHLMTTSWVLSAEYAGFPLLYHWRVLPDTPPDGFVDEFGGVEGAVAHWDGSAAVRRRLEAIGAASASLVLFLEHVPHTLADWLRDARETAGPRAMDDPTNGSSPGSAGGSWAYLWAEDALRKGTEFMSGRGLVHFDAHFRNLLTDGRQVYFADLGLALSRDFELSPAERRFLNDHLPYDRSYVPTHLLRHHLPDEVRGGVEPGAFLRAWTEGDRPDSVPPGLAALIDRHAPHALVLDDFHHRLLNRSKRTPFPAAEVRRALAAGSLSAEG